MDAPTKFRVNCTCGDHVLVSEGAAGATFACSCGKSIQIPSSIQLRLDAGLAPIVPPEETVERMIMSGTIPGNETCAFCGNTTQELIQVLTTCERLQTRHSGGFSWALLIFSLIFLPVRIFYGEPPQKQQFGRDKIYPLPLFICEKCLPALSDAAAIKKCLRKVPEYRDLLDKFPNACVSLIG